MTIDEIRIKYHTLKGIEQGREQVIGAMAEIIIDLLSDVGEVSAELIEKISSQKDIDTLKKWINFSARSKSINEFYEKIND